MFIVNNLQYYLQVDVIEAQFSVLQKAVTAASEFEDIIKLHTKFLTDLMTKTFVMKADEVSHIQNRITTKYTTFHFQNAVDGNKHQLYQSPNLDYESTSKVKLG